MLVLIGVTALGGMAALIFGVAVKVGELMIALPKPNRHADCINIILSLGLATDIQNQWGKSVHQGFYWKMGSSIHVLKHFYMQLNVANKMGRKPNRTHSLG